MCIVVDTCVFGDVFIKTRHNHKEYEPVEKFILKGEGKIVYGGRHYREEMPSSYYNLLLNFSNKRKTIPISDIDVDNKEKEIKKKYLQNKFNDPHLIALILLSESRLFCTSDKDLLDFLRIHHVYSAFSLNKLKIYTNKKHCHLLCHKNIPKKYIDKDNNTKLKKHKKSKKNLIKA